MSDLVGAVRTFLATYEAATQSQDATQLVSMYAESFVFADPVRATAIRREDFARAIPMRQTFFAQVGLETTKLTAFDVAPLADGYCLVNATWTMRFRKGGSVVQSENKASYILRRLTDEWEIVFQLDHQDLQQRTAELGLH